MDPRTRNQTRRHRRHGLRQRAGFTLVELLAVIGILGLLMGILALTVTSVHIRTRVQKSQFVISQLAGAIRIFHNERGEYPPSYNTDYFGSELLVLALTGYQDEDDDGKTGWGFRDKRDDGTVFERGKVYGPYNETHRLQRARTSDSPVKFEFVDAFDTPILYYRYDSEEGYLASHNDEARDDAPNPPSNLGVYLRGPGNEYFRKDFVLISPGPDGRYDQYPYIQAPPPGAWNSNCDDITNFMGQ